jgi:ribose 5-phosphate isomerase A
MCENELKLAAAQAAIAHVLPDRIVGVGTGSTVNFFIRALAALKAHIGGAVASSDASAALLKETGIRVLDLNEVTDLPVYVDGADEVTGDLAMIKGGGGALTREKIVAAAANKFVCIADETKLKPKLGNFPVPLEVIPMARQFVAREVTKFGGEARLREGFVTDNGNEILDVRGFDLSDPIGLECRLDGIPGVVANGVFARRRADVLLLATASGVQTFTAS